MRITHLLLFAWLVASVTSHAAGELPLEKQSFTYAGDDWSLWVPSGMQLELLTDRLQQPRMMEFLPNGVLLVGSRSGNVYRLAPPYSEASVLVELEDYPHSLAYRDGELLIAQTDGLYRATFDPNDLTLDWNAIERVVELPSGGGHSSRTVGIGPDGKAYMAIGISGNCSDEYLDDSYAFNDRRGGVLLLDEQQPQPRWRTYATGLRNPVGFDWHPDTGVMYASNNGPDHLGYNQPPEYFSRLTHGSYHGMPWFQYDGEQVERDYCIRRLPPRPLDDVVKPVATFPARNAPMGVHFAPDSNVDERLHKQAIVALKGSWGTLPSGNSLGKKSTRRPPALVMVEFRDGKATGAVHELVTGFQRPDGERLARPVGVQTGPDGYLYFTSDSHTQGLFRLRPRTDGK